MAASAIDLNRAQAFQKTSYCDACKAPNPKSRCGSCKLIQYCNRDCQTGAWKIHKAICSIIQKYSAAIVLPPASTGPISATLVEGNERVPLTQERFRDMTGCLYSHKAVLTPERIRSAIGRGALPFLQKIQESFPIQVDPDAVALQENPLFGLSLIALKPITRGQVICYFGGELVPRSNERSYRKTQYAITRESASLDQDTYIGMGVFTNDGFPNASILDPRHYGQGALNALTDISPGEEIYIDYAPTHPVKTGMYHIAPSSYAMIVAFCQNSFAQAMQKITPQNLQSIIGSFDSDINRMKFIYHTPPVLVNLLLDGVLSLKTVNIFFKKMSQVEAKGQFLQVYPDLLQAIKKIIEAGPDVIAATKTLMHEVTISAFMTVIPHSLSQEQAPVSVALIEELTIAGKLIDQAYLLTNGTIRGSYLDTTDPFPRVAIDEPAFVAQYRQLSKPRQMLITYYLTQSIDMLVPLQINLAVDQESPAQQLSRLRQNCQ